MYFVDETRKPEKKLWKHAMAGISFRSPPTHRLKFVTNPCPTPDSVIQ